MHVIIMGFTCCQQTPQFLTLFTHVKIALQIACKPYMLSVQNLQGNPCKIYKEITANCTIKNICSGRDFFFCFTQLHNTYVIDIWVCNLIKGRKSLPLSLSLPSTINPSQSEKILAPPSSFELVTRRIAFTHHPSRPSCCSNIVCKLIR